MGTKRGILTLAIILTTSVLPIACKKGLPREVEDLVFNGDKFTSPVVLSLPADLSVKEESWYRDALKTSWLPPLAPVSGKLTNMSPELKDILLGLGFIRVIELPGMRGTTTQKSKYFQYTEKAPADRNLLIAKREKASIEFKNRYKINPDGMGEREVSAMRFKYKLVPMIADFTEINEAYDAEAKAISNPDTGRWELEELTLRDPNAMQYFLKIAETRLPEFRRKAEAILVKSEAEQLADRILERAPEVLDSSEETKILKQKRTMTDMSSIGTAIGAYAADNNIYPLAATLEKLVQKLEQRYIARLPRQDQWGNEFRYITNLDAQDYWIISFGADGTADSGIYGAGGIPNGTGNGPTDNFNNDIIFSHGFIRYPRELQH